MENTMQFQQNARVFTADGEEIGHITRIVMHPETKVVSHIVVRIGSLFKKEEKLVPMGQIAETSEDQIIVNQTTENVDALPPFEEKHYVPAEENFSSPSAPSGQVTGVYGMGMSVPISTPKPEEKYVEKVEQNIPEGMIAVQEGAKVLTSEGKVVGKMERVVTELPTDQATHLIVSQGLVNEEKKLVPIHWVQILGEKEIYLGVDQDTIKDLENISE